MEVLQNKIMGIIRKQKKVQKFQKQIKTYQKFWDEFKRNNLRIRRFLDELKNKSIKKQ